MDDPAIFITLLIYLGTATLLNYLTTATRLILPVVPVRAPGRLQLDLPAVFDVTFEGLIDQQSVTEDSTRPSFYEHAS